MAHPSRSNLRSKSQTFGILRFYFSDSSFSSSRKDSTYSVKTFVRVFPCCLLYASRILRNSGVSRNCICSVFFLASDTLLLLCISAQVIILASTSPICKNTRANVCLARYGELFLGFPGREFSLFFLFLFSLSHWGSRLLMNINQSGYTRQPRARFLFGGEA